MNEIEEGDSIALEHIAEGVVFLDLRTVCSYTILTSVECRTTAMSGEEK